MMFSGVWGDRGGAPLPSCRSRSRSSVVALVGEDPCLGDLVPVREAPGAGVVGREDPRAGLIVLVSADPGMAGNVLVRDDPCSFSVLIFFRCGPCSTVPVLFRDTTDARASCSTDARAKVRNDFHKEPGIPLCSSSRRGPAGRGPSCACFFVT